MESFQHKIIGTSHVAKESVKEIEKEIESFKPDYVCIELDAQRLNALLSKQKTSFNPKLIKQIGLMGYLFGVVGHVVQQKIGKKLNIVPGKDMLTAYLVAKKHKIKIVLIDQNVRITLKNVSKNFNSKERWKLVRDILEGIFFKKRAMKKAKQKLGNVSINLNEVPSEKVINLMINNLKTEYPGLHKALVEDRNIFMSDNICKILKKEPTKKVLAIVGAGHKKEMNKLIKSKTKTWEYIGYSHTTTLEYD